MCLCPLLFKNLYFALAEILSVELPDLDNISFTSDK